MSVILDALRRAVNYSTLPGAGNVIDNSPSVPNENASSSLPSTDVPRTLARLTRDIRVPAKVVLGTYFTKNDWNHTVKGANYSTTIRFIRRLSSVPRVLISLRMLDIGRHYNEGDNTIRVDSRPKAESVNREGFSFSVWSWSNTLLHNAGMDWIAIEEPGWQSGVFRSVDVRPWGQDWTLDHRIDFAKPFEVASRPMIFVAYNSLDLAGRWNIRTYALNADHTGFTMSIVNCGEEEALTKVMAVGITWIAIPSSDILQKRNVWIGAFATNTGGRNVGTRHDGEGWNGHVDFGIEFKRVPKIFVGFNYFKSHNGRNLRMRINISNVTTTGMDWRIEKWSDTHLFHAGANFIAVDTD